VYFLSGFSAFRAYYNSAMIRRRLNYLGFFARLTTLLLPLLAFAVAGYLRFASGLMPLATTDIDSADYFGLLLFTTIVWAVVIDQFGLSHFDVFFASRNSARSALVACAATYVAVFGATFFYRSASFSRLFVGLSAAVLFLVVVLSQRVFRALLGRALQKPHNRTRILIIGADEFASLTARSLQSGPLPCAVSAFVRLPGQEVAIESSPVIELEGTPQLLAQADIDDIVIAVPTMRFGEIPALMNLLEPFCLPIRAVLDFGRKIEIRETLFDFGGLPMLDLRASPSESVLYLVAKRSFDLVFSALALILCGPFMTAIAVGIRLSSPGPALFGQDRVGLNGRVFRMYKFRTMRTSTPEESDTRWTTADDPRRTRLGAFLRQTNLDELPQFLNVLKGEMSIVGPRPERPYFVQRFLEDIAQYNRRHYLKVGITGWAQVNGWRGDTSIARRVEHDLYYLAHWSLLLDFKIIFLTVWRTLMANRNAY
jgi:Undecaprenyl-phosphate glucose phosphotransferase